MGFQWWSARGVSGGLWAKNSLGGTFVRKNKEFAWGCKHNVFCSFKLLGYVETETKIPPVLLGAQNLESFGITSQRLFDQSQAGLHVLGTPHNLFHPKPPPFAFKPRKVDLQWGEGGCPNQILFSGILLLDNKWTSQQVKQTVEPGPKTGVCSVSHTCRPAWSSSHNLCETIPKKLFSVLNKEKRGHFFNPQPPSPSLTTHT